MGGINPYIENLDAPLPTRAYRITFQPAGEVVEVDPAQLPYSREGRPGSLLEIAIGHDIDLDHAWGLRLLDLPRHHRGRRRELH